MLTVYGENTTEKIIERSKFITYSCHVESEEEARNFIAEIRKEHSLATHVCFAFVADKTGNLMRFSDDGEPQGTAGIPMLEVIKNKKLFETAVAVVRYFGGIKLGAGGLVRAYSSSVSENLDVADIRALEVCEELEISVDYTDIDAVQKFCASRTCEVIDTLYGEKVAFRICVKKCDVETFKTEIFDALLGKSKAVTVAEYYRAFRI